MKHAKQWYKGRLFSVLGDSISTFEDMQPLGYPVYYQYERRQLNDLSSHSDCWWQQVIDAFGGKLLANASFSGGYVVKSPYYPESLASALHPDRRERLSQNGREPDVILLYLGTNDLGYGTMAEKQDPLCCFPTAYSALLAGLRARYPQAELWCFTLCPSDASPFSHADFMRYNAVIAQCAKQAGACLVDLYDPAFRYSTEDGLHPNRKGMVQIAEAALKSLAYI